MRSAAKMFPFDPNPTRTKNDWSSSTCLLYGFRKDADTLDFHFLRGSIPPIFLLCIYSPLSSRKLRIVTHRRSSRKGKVK
jgi:hypothetical protein